MNILQLEQERTSLKEKLLGAYSSQAKLLFLYSYIEKVLSTQNKNLIESYLPEFIPDYFRFLKSWTVFGMKPRMHELVINQADQIEKINFIPVNSFGDLTSSIHRLKKELADLNRLLNGESSTNYSVPKAFFPLLEEDAIKETGTTVGVIESVTIKIQKARDENKFIIIPSEKEIEEKISEQVRLSWLNALSIAKKYIKRIYTYHEVIISFDKKAGFCKGNSLGTALTLSFIEEIFKTYNSPLSIKVGDGIAFTGGMDEQGSITNTLPDIIKQKAELIFFSDISVFIVPKKEESTANEKLNELKKEFPQRDLKIIGIEDINDLLDRRTIVEIKKQPIVVRSGKFLKKNWVSAAVAILLTVILSFLFVLDFDTNPMNLSLDSGILYVKNKAGKILWSEKVDFPVQAKEQKVLKKYCRIYDVDNNGVNEVLMVNKKSKKNTDLSAARGLICFDKDKKVVWSHSFSDVVNSKNETMSKFYRIFIIDSLTFSNRKSLFLIAVNSVSFASAIYRIDLRSGNRLPGTVWSSGHNVDALIKDLDDDKEMEIIAIGCDNGFEQNVLYSFDIDTLNESRQSTVEYTINNYPLAKLISYIRLPKLDFSDYYHIRLPMIQSGSFIEDIDQNGYRFTIFANLEENNGYIAFKLDHNLKDFDIIISNELRVIRDSLVVNGLLIPPYTDTPEYVKLLKSKILYYKNGEWVNREDLR